MTDFHTNKECWIIIQPTLKHYRIAVFDGMAQLVKIVACGTQIDEDKTRANDQATLIKLKEIRVGGMIWQRGVISTIRKFRPNCIIVAADIHYISTWATLLYCRLKKIPVNLHGHGFFKRTKHFFLRKILVKLMIQLAKSYIAYAEIVSQSLIAAGVPRMKIKVVQNRFEKSDKFQPVLDGLKYGILFIGRLRPGSEIEKLIEAVKILNENSPSVYKLHIVGEGNALSKKNVNFSWLKMYGRIISQERLQEIASECEIGVYPGRAGLSVLTYMGFGLAPIVVSDLGFHMGPEPSYVKNGINGWVFQHGSAENIANAIHSAFQDEDLKRVRMRAWEFYKEIHKVPYSVELFSTVNGIINQQPARKV